MPVSLSLSLLLCMRLSRGKAESVADCELIRKKANNSRSDCFFLPLGGQLKIEATTGQWIRFSLVVAAAAAAFPLRCIFRGSKISFVLLISSREMKRNKLIEERNNNAVFGVYFGGSSPSEIIYLLSRGWEEEEGEDIL